MVTDEQLGSRITGNNVYLITCDTELYNQQVIAQLVIVKLVKICLVETAFIIHSAYAIWLCVDFETLPFE